MDLSTNYLGLQLANPLMPGSSPLADDVDLARRFEDAGAAAIVVRSLFEEQLVMEQLASAYDEREEKGPSEAISDFPGMDRFKLDPESYLEHVQRLKQAVGVPVIASLNGITPGGWVNFASLIERAGADALELNVYHVATDPEESGESVEQQAIQMVRSVKEKVSLPVAVKLSPFYSSFAHFAGRLQRAGAEGLVLFNRFYQPDIDIEQRSVERSLRLSDSRELRLRLRWLAILSGKVDVSMAASGGVHTSRDAIKTIMAGAHAVQMVSGLLQEGPERLREMCQEIADWLEQHECESLSQLVGCMSLERCPDARAYERANYLEILQTWRASIPLGRWFAS